MKKGLGRIKTGKFERRMSMLRAGFSAGARLAGRSATNLINTSENRKTGHKKILREEADRFVEQIGQLKGSVVKIGQMMALWGEHYLPEEVTLALHQLEDQTSPVDWEVIKVTLEQELDQSLLDELEIDPQPIGAASLGQVHKATRKADGAKLCLKIQYPAIADAIETDLDAVSTLMKLFRLAPNTKEFDLWFAEIRDLLRREVDYKLEADTTRRFDERFQDDDRFIVPKIFERYSTQKVLCLSFEQGVPIASQVMRNLSQERRNHIAKACLDVCWMEIFRWGEMQTDPNFGNYLVRINEDAPDQLVLLDFGAVRAFEPDILRAGKKLVSGSLFHQGETIATALRNIGFYTSQTPPKVIQHFIEICYVTIEPFVNHDKFPPENPELIDDAGCYDWAQSRLATRTLLRAKDAALSRHFNVPPKDFMYFSRKLIGTFTLMSVLNAKINGYKVIQPHLGELDQ